MTREVDTVSRPDGPTEKEKNQTSSGRVLWFREETGSKRDQGRLLALPSPLEADANEDRPICRRIHRVHKHSKGDLMPKRYSGRRERNKTPRSLRLWRKLPRRFAQFAKGPYHKISKKRRSTRFYPSAMAACNLYGESMKYEDPGVLDS